MCDGILFHRQAVATGNALCYINTLTDGLTTVYFTDKKGY